MLYKGKVGAIIINKGIVKINLGDITYDIEIDKLLFIVRRLKNNPVLEFKDEKDIIAQAKLCGLCDRAFLNKVNKMW